MTKIRVVVSDAFLRRQLKKPRRGVIELIDNALDADATRIDVELHRSEAGAVDKVVVRDNGEGMTEHVARTAFGDYGDSWKVDARKTESGRRRRGSRGTGRWAAFSIGTRVSWHSSTHPVVSIDLTRDPTVLHAVQILGDVRTIREFDIDPVAPGEGPGTVVTVSDVTTKGQQVDHMTDELTNEYSVALRRQPDLAIVYDGHELNPTDVIVDIIDLTADFLDALPDPDHMPSLAGVRENEGPGAVKLTVVEWDRSVRNPRSSLVLADAAGNGLHDWLDGVTRAPWSYTAYLSWDGFLAERAHLGYDIGQSDETEVLLRAALRTLSEYVRAKRDTRRARLVAAWKNDGSYPYASDAHGALEEAERDLFDVIAATAAPVLEDMDPAARKFSLHMMREALTKDPTQLGTVLVEVLNLDKDQLAELHELLERTTLPALIAAGGVVTHRLDIINGLQQVLHDVDEAPNLLEREHLHKIVAAESWLFGDEYTTAVNERSLTEVLRAHRRILGPDRVLLDPDSSSDTGPDAPVLVDGKPGRVDLMLSRVSPLTATVRQHLIVELKRPGIIGPDEITQLEKYAFEIRKDSRFTGQDVRWDFVLIGTKLSEFARDKAKQFDASATTAYRVRILTWDDLLHNRRHQLNFVQDALNVTTNADTGTERLRTIHGTHLPPQAMSGPTNGPKDDPTNDRTDQLGDDAARDDRPEARGT